MKGYSDSARDQAPVRPEAARRTRYRSPACRHRGPVPHGQATPAALQHDVQTTRPAVSPADARRGHDVPADIAARSSLIGFSTRVSASGQHSPTDKCHRDGGAGDAPAVAEVPAVVGTGKCRAIDGDAYAHGRRSGVDPDTIALMGKVAPRQRITNGALLASGSANRSPSSIQPCTSEARLPTFSMRTVISRASPGKICRVPCTTTCALTGSRGSSTAAAMAQTRAVPAGMLIVIVPVSCRARGCPRPRPLNGR